jgi:hypothetical protein
LIVALAEFILCIGPILAAIPALLVAVTHAESAAFVDFCRFSPNSSGRGQSGGAAHPAAHDFYSANVGAARDRRHRRIGGRHGLVLATPIVVVIFVFMQKAYVRDALKARRTYGLISVLQNVLWSGALGPRHSVAARNRLLLLDGTAAPSIGRKLPAHETP